MKIIRPPRAPSRGRRPRPAAAPARSVLVVGAGVAGPTLAYWLERNGLDVVLIEQAPRFRSGGYMIDFWGVGFDVAERMSIIPRLRRDGYTIDNLVFVDDHGRERSGVHGKTLRDAVGERFVSLPRADLARAALDAICGRVEVRFGETVADLSEHDERVDVTFGSGATHSFDLVIGCDGLHSQVRAAISEPAARCERYLGYHAASFVTQGYPRRNEHTYLSWAAPGRQISRYALRGGRTAILFVFASASYVDGPIDAEDGARVLRSVFGRDRWIEVPDVLAHLDACDDLYFDAVSQIELPRWSQGRIALVGDAAYCPSLLAGEGAGLAMAGAYVLAGELARAGGDHHVAFPAYERRLRRFVDGKQTAAARFASAFAPRTRFGLFVRDLVVRASALPLIGHRFLRRFIADDFGLPHYAAARVAVHTSHPLRGAAP